MKANECIRELYGQGWHAAVDDTGLDINNDTNEATTYMHEVCVIPQG